MLFNSNFFVHIFIPILLIVYFLVFSYTKYPVKFGNSVLLFFSLLFYLCTGGKSIVILLTVIIFNYFMGILISREYKIKKLCLGIGVSGNIGVLLFFKYIGFLYDNVVSVLRLFSVDLDAKLVEVILPVGISFYIFQAISYLIDVYKKDVGVQYNFFEFTLYISFFPQLIAGPIVRYKTISNEIESREIQLTDVYEGACRFIYGLGKKVLIADIIGTSVDAIWGLPKENLSTGLAWSAAFLYTLQIYFDFSGYSDMAIGVGRIFGFHFNENFIHPYTAQNMRDFWKKWHISLSSFLREYIYIPLGGNRKGAARTYLNLLIIFFICGLWHGAAWNFVVWGIYHGMFLVIERVLKNKIGFAMKGVSGRIATFFLVMIGWLFFRAPTVSDAFSFIGIMFGKESLEGFQYYSFGYYIYPKIVCIALFAFVSSFFPFEKLRNWFYESRIKGVGAIVILLISMAFIADASFTPFIYFQF